MIPFGLVQFLGNNIIPKVEGRERLLSLGRHPLRLPDVKSFCVYMQQTGYKITSSQNYTSFELFHDFGFLHVDDVDNCPDEGTTILHDMNLPLCIQNSYDLVIDIGTLEHIFDIAQAIKNVLTAVKIGGYVLHISPMTWLNHGFYNFGPTFFYDVYRCNGFDQGKFWLIAFSQQWDKPDAIVSAYNYTFNPNQILVDPAFADKLLLIGFLAQKHENVPFKVPSQAAYDAELGLDTLLRVHSGKKHNTNS